jgi:hypothetical protein
MPHFHLASETFARYCIFGDYAIAQGRLRVEICIIKYSKQKTTLFYGVAFALFCVCLLSVERYLMPYPVDLNIKIRRALDEREPHSADDLVAVRKGGKQHGIVADALAGAFVSRRRI